jgi:hypothetical protein
VGSNPRFRLIIALIAVLVVGLLAGFAIGRASKSSSAPALSGSGPRTEIDLTGASDLTTHVDSGWFSAPTSNQTREFAVPGPAISVYETRTGSKVIAWFYEACGMPQGLVPPHHTPRTCRSTGTTAP